MNSHLKHIILLLIVFCLKNNSAIADANLLTKYNISYITINEGLSCNFIEDIYKDSRGFLWISTAGGGIVRYDGYEFITYDINTESAPLKSNFTSMICEDDFNRLWISTECGINVLDLITNEMTEVRDIYNKACRMWAGSSIYVRKDSHGDIWIKSCETLYKLKLNESGEIYEEITLKIL